MDNLRELDYIQFGICSAEEIRKQSVCEVYHLKLTGPHSVYDERMGTLDTHKLCSTCEKNDQNCVGHFGHIELNCFVLHPLFNKLIMSILKCVCYKCSKILLGRDQLELSNLLRLQSKIRFNKILEKMDRIEFCSECQCFQPKFVFSSQDRNIYMMFKMDGEVTRIQMNEKEIFEIFEKMTKEDVRLLGFNPLFFHPRDLIIRVLPVLPPVARPFIVADNMMCDDDLTIQYLEIVKANHHLRDVQLSESKRQKYAHALKFRIKSLFDNSGDRQRVNNGRPLKGIKKRLTGKEGLIRNNLMGKRVDKSARTVIGPDPTLAVNEIAIPEHIANILTYPVRVNKYNREEIDRMIAQNEATFLLRNEGSVRINLKYATTVQNFRLQFGDFIMRNATGKTELVRHERQLFSLHEKDIVFRDGVLLEGIKMNHKKRIAIGDGDIIERKLRDGDILLLNRQPTLHKGSMIAQKVRILKGNTIRLNLAVTSSFNADFDGDEMNLHCPANPETEAELRELSSLENNIINPQSSKANIVIVQDSLLGAYKMTLKNQVLLKKDEFFQILTATGSHVCLSRLASKQKLYYEYCSIDSPVYDGRLLFSLLLPNHFYYKSLNNADPEEPEVVIKNGVLIKGAIKKTNLGSSHSSLITLLFHEYGETMCTQFINDLQFMTREYLLWCGFSVGIRDCVVTREEEIQTSISRSFLKAKSIEEHTNDESIREIYISYALGGARDTGLAIAKNALSHDNSFVQTVISGAKGDYFNIAQITGLLGQQNLNGKRISPCLSDMSRTLPHYPIDPSQYNDETRYESKGFIRSCFVKGLAPRDFYFHAMTGREGITDTAMKSVTGDTYIFISRDEICCQVKIGEWIDELFAHSDNNNISTETMELSEPVYIPSVDEKGSMDWCLVTHVTRHEPTEMMYKIITSTGRTVTVTDAKSLLVFVNGRFREKHMSSIRIGDALPVSYFISGIASDMKCKGFDLSKIIIDNDCISIHCESEYELNYNIMLCSQIEVFGFIHGFIYRIYFPWASCLYQTLFPKTKKRKIFPVIAPNVHIIKDVVLDPIIEIVPMHGYKQKVYDLTIPKTLNFGLANGLQVRDTATSGYIQRRMIKIAEDVKVCYDGTVRNGNGNILQLAYGENFMNPIHTSFYRDEPVPIQPSRIVESLNDEFLSESL